jgi:hypothetical protein
MTPLFPQVTVRLVGEDGNAYSILGRVTHALKRAGVERSQIDAFAEAATSGDYNHLLRTVMETVSIAEDDEDDEEVDEWGDDYDDDEEDE